MSQLIILRRRKLYKMTRRVVQMRDNKKAKSKVKIKRFPIKVASKDLVQSQSRTMSLYEYLE